MTFKKSMLFAALASLFLSTNAQCPRRKKPSKTDTPVEATAAASGRRSATDTEAPTAEYSVRRDGARPFFEVLEANLNTLKPFVVGYNDKDQEIVTEALIHLWPSKNGLESLDRRIKWDREPQPFTHYAFAIGFLCGRPDSTCIPPAHGLYKMLLEAGAEGSDTLLSFVDGFLEGSAFKHAITIQDKQWSLSKANRSVQEDYIECLTTFKTKPFSEGVDKHARSQKEILEGSDLRRLTTGNYLLNLGAIAWGAAYRTSLLRAEARLTSEKRGECWNMTYYRWRVEHITKMLFGAGAVIPDELALAYLSPLERIPSAVAERSPTATASAGTTRVHINTSNDHGTILFDEMLAAAMTRGPNLTVGDMPVTIIEAIAADSGALHDTLVKNAITRGARTPASTTSSSNASRGLLDNPASATEIAAKRKAEKLAQITADKEKKAEKTRARQAAEAERNARRIDRDKDARAAEKEAHAKATQEEPAKKITIHKQKNTTPASNQSAPEVAQRTELSVAAAPVAPKPAPVDAAAACEGFETVLGKGQKRAATRAKKAETAGQKQKAISAPLHNPLAPAISASIIDTTPTKPEPAAAAPRERGADDRRPQPAKLVTSEPHAERKAEAERTPDAKPARQETAEALHLEQPALVASDLPGTEATTAGTRSATDEAASKAEEKSNPRAEGAMTDLPQAQEQEKQSIHEADEKMTEAAPQENSTATTQDRVTQPTKQGRRRKQALKATATEFAPTYTYSPQYAYYPQPFQAYQEPYASYVPYTHSIPMPYVYAYGTVPFTYYPIPTPAPWIQPQAPTENTYDAGWRAGRDLLLNREVEAADKHMALKRAECCAEGNVNLDFNRGFIDGYASCQAAPSTK